MDRRVWAAGVDAEGRGSSAVDGTGIFRYISICAAWTRWLCHYHTCLMEAACCASVLFCLG